MPRREKSPDPWRDCPTCSWRNYAQSSAKANPVRVEAFTIVNRTPPERCGGCGEPLVVELDRLDAKPLV